ncbi:MAG: DMT family transporter [Pseudomonadota bacterium]
MAFVFSVLPLAQTYAILFSMPLLITVLAIPILGEKVGIHRWGAILVGLTGVFVVLRPGSTELNLGHAAAMAAAICGALAAIIVRKIGRDERSAVLLLYPMMANFVLMAGLLVLVYEPMPIEHLGLVGLMAALSFVAGLFLIVAYKNGDAAIVAPMQYSQIIWAAVYGLYFFQEQTDRVTWIGAAIIIASGLYIILREAVSGRSASAPVTQSRVRPETATSPRVGVALMRQALRAEPGYRALAKTKPKT